MPFANLGSAYMHLRRNRGLENDNKTTIQTEPLVRGQVAHEHRPVASRDCVFSHAYDSRSVSTHVSQLSPHQMRLNALRRCLESGMPIAGKEKVPQHLRARLFSQTHGPLVRVKLLGTRSST